MTKAIASDEQNLAKCFEWLTIHARKSSGRAIFLIFITLRVITSVPRDGKALTPSDDGRYATRLRQVA
jgi:hypothetical protein